MKKTLTLLALAATAFGVQAQSTSYAIDPGHTFVTFEVSHFGTSTTRGRFDKKEGMVQLDRAARTGRAELSFDMASVSTGVPQLDKHLQNKDFFDVENHPSAKFVGDRFVFDGDKLSAVAGTLTMMGKTHPVTLKANRFNCFQHPMLKREVCGGDFETTIQRTLWGISYGAQGPVSDDVRLLIQVEAVKQQ